jgi:hypothetical protein
VREGRRALCGMLQEAVCIIATVLRLPGKHRSVSLDSSHHGQWVTVSILTERSTIACHAAAMLSAAAPPPPSPLAAACPAQELADRDQFLTALLQNYEADLAAQQELLEPAQLAQQGPMSLQDAVAVLQVGRLGCGGLMQAPATLDAHWRATSMLQCIWSPVSWCGDYTGADTGVALMHDGQLL